MLILNGDTFYRIGLGALSAFHEEKQADCSLCLKPMKDFDRFGVVELDGEQRVRGFREKQYYPAGLINGGVYALNRESLMRESWPPVFSFEKDYLERFVGGMESMRDGMEGAAGRVDRRVFGLVQDSYFIDMGIPEDYRRAQKELTDQQL